MGRGRDGAGGVEGRSGWEGRRGGTYNTSGGGGEKERWTKIGARLETTVKHEPRRGAGEIDGGICCQTH